jgi:hypothetical protein
MGVVTTRLDAFSRVSVLLEEEQSYSLSRPSPETVMRGCVSHPAKAPPPNDTPPNLVLNPYTRPT